MTHDNTLKGIQAVLACETAIACGQVGSATATHHDVDLEKTAAPIRNSGVERDLFKRVLVAVDDSQPSNWSLRVAINLAKVCGGQLALVHVIHGEMALTPEFAMPRPDVVENVHRSAEEFLNHEKSVAPAELKVETFLKVGDPSHQIITTALTWDAGLIVIGTHGRAGVPRMLIGSTAESVVRGAHCPVLTVGHDPDDQAMRLAANREAALASLSPFRTD